VRLVGVLVAAVVLVGAGSAAKVPGPAALLTYTAVPHADPDDGQYLACIARANGTRRLRIVSGDLSASAPAWNRAGTRVAFTGSNLPAAFRSQDEDDIVVANSRGRLLRNLTPDFSRSNFNPKWSPDGKWIAFASSVLSLMVVPSDGSAPPTVVDVP
jgi:Tol biopolymer transport system component